MKKRSDIISASASPVMNMFRKGLLHGAGYNTDGFQKRPLIAIANSHTELTTGHSHLNLLASKVKEGIIAAGGEAAEFNVPAPCDGVAMAHDGMRFVLAQRDLIADIVETHIRSQPYDGVVFIAGCDKINPGMMMAAARLDLPSIYLSAGPGQMDIRNTQGQRGSIDHGDYKDDPSLFAKTSTCSTCGACEIMGTANTFQCLAEVFGFCLPGSANIPGWHSDKLQAARATGERVVGLVEEGLNARQLFTPAAFENAIKMAIAIGGSTNSTLHLPAIAQCAEVPLNLTDFEAVADIPTLLSISPNGPYGVQDLWAAGGMPAVIKRMAPHLDLSCMTVSGLPLAAVAEAAVVMDAQIIPPLDKPFRADAGIVVLRGNIATEGCVIKAAGVSENMQVCSGPARCFDTEEEALAAINNDEVRQGEVVVLRYQGPKGSPGMPEMLGVTLALKTKGLNEAALITDGRFSGATSGPCVGHIGPEASDGGLIALIEEGDIIEIDIPGRRLHLAVDDAEITRRREHWQPLEKPVPVGFMRRYRKLVGPACEGAVMG
ncbi:MAG: dihydroxy-acid dehydratase [Parahaliea sp.]